MARGDCLASPVLSARLALQEKRGIEAKWAPPGRQVKWGRWVTLEYLELRGHLDRKGSQGLLVLGDPLASEDRKAEGV